MARARFRVPLRFHLLSGCITVLLASELPLALHFTDRCSSEEPKYDFASGWVPGYWPGARWGTSFMNMERGILGRATRLGRPNVCSVDGEAIVTGGFGG